MKMKYILSHNDAGINELLMKYSPIDFGIGIDDGNILCTKIGKGWDTNTQDLIWTSNAVNKAVALSDLSHSPSHISISNNVYSNLTDEVRYNLTHDYWGNEQRVDMWTQNHFSYNNSVIPYYYTNYYWTVL